MTNLLEAEPPTPEELWHNCKKLKGYLVRLTHNPDDADDLIADTWIHASKGLHTFVPGSNLNAWLTKIARNIYLEGSKRLSKKMTVQDSDGIYATHLVYLPEQEWFLVGQDIQAAFEKLPAAQCRAVKLSIGDELSYEYIAELEHVPIGTIRSRINRGRERLMHLLCEEVPTSSLSIQ